MDARPRMHAALTEHPQLIPPLAHIIEEYALDFTAHTMTLERAKADRARLMQERSAFTNTLSENNFERHYSCKPAVCFTGHEDAYFNQCTS